jgi:hypothetical protein
MSTESVRARLEAATPGTWKADSGGCCVGTDDADIAEGSRHPHAHTSKDIDFIAHAPADIAAAMKVIEAAKRILLALADEAHFVDHEHQLRDALDAWEALP